MSPLPDSVAAKARAAQAITGLLSVLKRLIPIAKRLVGFVRVISIVSAVCALTIIVSWFIIVRELPRTPLPIFAALIAIILFVLPAIILRLFYNALREVLALPAWLKTSPEIAREHGAELTDLIRTVAGAPGQATDQDAVQRRAVRELPRAGKLLLEAHKDLPEYGSVLRLMNVPFLLAVLASFAATIFFAITAPLMVFVAIVLQVI